MKSIHIGAALKSSNSLRPPLLATAIAVCHEKIEVSSIQVRKTSTLEHSNSIVGRLNHLQICKLNYPESANKYYTGFHRHQRQRTKVLATDGKSFGATLNVIYRFSKVYTLQGTVLSIISISLLAIQKLSDFTPLFFIGVLQAVIGGSLANSYVASINQLSDIDIDKINKPHLPLASGEISVKTAIRLTLLYAILGFFLGWSIKSWPLKLGLFLWYAVGTAYSVDLPLLRWKRDPALAAMSVWSLQGTIIPILFHLHAQDIPDVEGDKINGVNSMASQVGTKTVIGHMILGFILWREANLVDLKNNEAIESFYLFIWKIYGAEYLLVPFLRF
ncbi:hypothetical protein L1887_03225 [Cichorium endivia]|nr:hypothetical protein L1887_03225 [Cichorium endivia]